jgi:hypothetical protein
MKLRNLVFIVALVFPMLLASQGLYNSGSGLFSNNASGTTPHFGMQVGSSFSTGFAGSGLFSQSIAPHLTFRPGKNFTLIAGSVLSTSSFSGGSPFMAGSAAPDRFYSTTVYALGAYQLNPRVTLTGAAWGERNNMNAMMYGSQMGPQMNPQAFNLNAGGVMMGLDYKISENISIGAEINLSRGVNPFNPYMNNNPFRNNNSYNNRRYPW